MPTTATEYKALLDAFTEAVEGAEKVKSASTDSPEVKAARSARQLLTTPGVELTPEVKAALEALGSHTPSGFDRSTGDLIATRVSNLLRVDEGDRSEAFNKVAQEAENLVKRWDATSTRRARGTGNATTDKSQLLSTYGIEGVTIAFDHNLKGEKAPHSITHHSTQSSLSNEVNKVARALNGFGVKGKVDFSYGVVDPMAREAWRNAMTKFKGGDTGPISFTIHTPKGNIEVTMSATRIEGWTPPNATPTSEAVASA